VLRGLRREGFEPFMVAQGRSRKEGKADFTKHMVRLRHADHVAGAEETKEIILINSHDGASSYQMLGGAFRWICQNGLVAGNVVRDIRVKHTGNVQGEVIEGAFRVLSDFEALDASTDAMKSTQLVAEEQNAFATAALTLRFGERTEGMAPAPVTAAQLLQPRRPEDAGNSLWQSLQRVQENSVKGGLSGRNANGGRLRTRAVSAIDGNLALNRALWVLAEEMRKLKG
jgi:hypothetical protein